MLTVRSNYGVLMMYAYTKNGKKPTDYSAGFKKCVFSKAHFDRLNERILLPEPVEGTSRNLHSPFRQAQRANKKLFSEQMFEKETINLGEQVHTAFAVAIFVAAIDAVVLVWINHQVELLAI